MSVYEIKPMDRLYDLVTELLQDGEDPWQIRYTTAEAIREWRIGGAAKEEPRAAE